MTSPCVCDVREQQPPAPKRLCAGVPLCLAKVTVNCICAPAKNADCWPNVIDRCMYSCLLTDWDARRFLPYICTPIIFSEHSPGCCNRQKSDTGWPTSKHTHVCPNMIIRTSNIYRGIFWWLFECFWWQLLFLIEIVKLAISQLNFVVLLGLLLREWHKKMESHALCLLFVLSEMNELREMRENYCDCFCVLSARRRRRREIDCFTVLRQKK